VTYGDECADPGVRGGRRRGAARRADRLVEPGRYLVANAGVPLTRVLYRKETVGKTYVITDCRDDRAPPAVATTAHTTGSSPWCSDGTTTVDVVGPVCESGDFFALDRRLTM